MSRNIKFSTKSIKSKISKSLSKSKYDNINTTEGNQSYQSNNYIYNNFHTNPTNIMNTTLESPRKHHQKIIHDSHPSNPTNHPFNYCSDLKKMFLSKPKKLKTRNISALNYMSITNNKQKKKQNKTSINSPIRRNEMISSNSNKDLQKAKEELSELKKLLLHKDVYINQLEKELTELKQIKSESNEYEEYAKKQMIRNVEMLSNENHQLREEIKKYKEKEKKMMKMLFNMSKKGIPIEAMIDCAEEDLDDKKTNNKINNGSNMKKIEEESNSLCSSTGTFIPLDIDNGCHNKNFDNIRYSAITKPRNVPKLNFNNVNKKYNDQYVPNKNNNIDVDVPDDHEYNCHKNKNDELSQNHITEDEVLNKKSKYEGIGINMNYVDKNNKQRSSGNISGNTTTVHSKSNIISYGGKHYIDTNSNDLLTNNDSVELLKNKNKKNENKGNNMKIINNNVAINKNNLYYAYNNTCVNMKDNNNVNKKECININNHLSNMLGQFKIGTKKKNPTKNKVVCNKSFNNI